MGDKVAVNLTLEEFKKVQESSKVPGGWTDEMKQVDTLYRISEVPVPVLMKFINVVNQS